MEGAYESKIPQEFLSLANAIDLPDETLWYALIPIQKSHEQDNQTDQHWKGVVFVPAPQKSIKEEYVQFLMKRTINEHAKTRAMKFAVTKFPHISTSSLISPKECYNEE